MPILPQNEAIEVSDTHTQWSDSLFQTLLQFIFYLFKFLHEIANEKNRKVRERKEKGKASVA